MMPLTPEQKQAMTPEIMKRYMAQHPQQQIGSPKTPEQIHKETLMQQRANTAVQVKGPDGNNMPMIVQAKDSVVEEGLHRNIATNIRLIDYWANEGCAPNKGRVLICSAGPSLEKYIDVVKKEQKSGSLIVCIKHSLPILIRNGIIPDACVILDPRDINGTSTHGILRKDLFKDIPKQTVFYVASMTMPGTTKLLLDRGARVLGWSAMVADITTHFRYNTPVAILGGSCSAIRAIPLFKHFGYSDFGLIGFDCATDGIPKDIEAKLIDGRPKYLKINIHGKDYITTGELIALIQDFEGLFQNSRILQAKIEVLGEGIIKDIYDKTYKPQPEYHEMLKNLKPSFVVE